MRNVIIAFLVSAGLGAGLGAAVGTAQIQYDRGRVAPQPVAAPPPQPDATHPRGRVAPPNLPAIYAAAEARNATVVRSLPPATEPAFDSREHGWVGPVKNQGNCGSCWDFSGIGVVEIAAAKAGAGKPGEFVLSEQYILDCNHNGGCQGDDNTTVLAHAKKTGVAFTKDYGPYHAREQSCKSTGLKLFQITDWGFTDGDRGYEKVSDTQLIKNCIKAYGSVGCAVAATSTWDGYRGGVHTGNSRQIDHDVILVGWQDDQNVHGGGYWIMRNSWGPDWGDKGYMKIGYGSDSIGTEAVFARVDAAPPPVPPDPTPVPPTPPAPPAPPAPNLAHFVIILAAIVVVLAVVILVLLRTRKVD